MIYIEQGSVLKNDTHTDNFLSEKMLVSCAMVGSTQKMSCNEYKVHAIPIWKYLSSKLYFFSAIIFIIISVICI